MLVKIDGEDRFVKDLTNNSLLNTDLAGLQEYKRKKQMQRR